MIDARHYTLADIAEQFGGEIVGDAHTSVKRVATLQAADPESITFLANPKYRAQLERTAASAVIVSAAMREATSLPRIVAKNPYAYFARVSALLNPPPSILPGVHPSAVVEAGAHIASTASVGALTFVAAGASIAERTSIGSGCRIGAGASVGVDSVLHSNVVIYKDCSIGARAIVHSGVVIGADGFGFAPEDGKWVKVPQVGRVRIGDDVEIGANTTIDRGTIEDTVIADGVKLDNQIQIGHNVQIGAHTAIAACVGIAGSAKIGARCQIGGAAGILGHLEIVDDVTISAFSLVTKSIRNAGVYTGVMPLAAHRVWLLRAAQFNRIDELAQRLAQLENQGKR